MRLSNEVISQIAKLVQLAIISGTDVVDHLRMIRVQPEDSGELVLTDEYRSNSDNHIQKMLNRIDEIKDKNKGDT